MVTGGPGTGKTSILLGLELQGEYIVREAARDYIAYQHANGVLRPTDMDDFEQQVLELHLLRESRIPQSVQRVFLDRGKPDQLAYSDLFGYPLPDHLRKIAQSTNYTRVFIVEFWNSDWTKIATNSEEQETAKLIELRLVETYKRLGYDLIYVPPGKLVDRLHFVLDVVNS